MQRQTRTLVLIAVVALVGVGALAMLANRYRGMTPTRSVHDLESAPTPAPEPIPPAAAPADTTLPGGAPATPAEPAATAAPSRAEVEVEAFRAGRCGMRGVADRAPGAMETIYREATNTTEGMNRVPMNPQVLMELRASRMRPLDAANVSAEDYVRIRDAYRKWKAGTPAADLGPYGAAFDRRKAELDACDLGKFEIIDDLLKR